MKNFEKYLLGILLLIMPTTHVLAQDAEMADGMRAEGKIYVVVAIILTVLAGFILYLFLQDRKLTKMEKVLHERENQIKR